MRLAGGAFLHQLAREFSALDILKDELHFLPCRFADCARTAGARTEFGRVGNRAIHAGNAARMDEIDDQFQLVQAFEIGELRRITRLDQRIETGLDQFHRTPTQHRLLAKQIGFGFRAKIGFDHANAAADRGAIGEAELFRRAADVTMHGDQADKTVAFKKPAAQRGARAGRRHHQHVEIVTRLDETEMDREAVDEKQRRAFFHDRREFFCINIGQDLIGRGHDDDIRIARSFGVSRYRKTFGLGLGSAGAAGIETDNDAGDVAVAHVECMRTALAAIADQGNFFAANKLKISVFAPVNPHVLPSSLCAPRRVESIYQRGAALASNPSTSGKIAFSVDYTGININLCRMPKEKERKPQELVKLDQPVLNAIIAKHELFRQGRAGGARAKMAHHDLSKLSFKGRDLAHADFTGSLLVEANFEGAKLDYAQFFASDLRQANFSGASLVRADMRGDCLRGAIMTSADLTDADLREGSFASYDPEKGLSFASDNAAWKAGTGGVDLRGATLSSAKLSGAIAINSNFEDANLSKATFVRGDLSGANLAGANLAGADLSSCELKNVNLRGAVLAGAMMDFSNLENVDMTGALTDQPMGKTLHDLPLTFEEMVKLHQLWLRTKGVEGKRLDLNGFDMRKAASLARSDLTMITAEKSVWFEQDFSQSNLQFAQFKDADMRDCNFTGTDMRGSNFTGARLVGAKLTGARLEPLLIESKGALRTCFVGAILRYTIFTGANLRDVDFSNADLSYADFTGADTTDTNFTGATLEKAKIDSKAAPAANNARGK